MLEEVTGFGLCESAESVAGCGLEAGFDVGIKDSDLCEEVRREPDFGAVLLAGQRGNGSHSATVLADMARHRGKGSALRQGGVHEHIRLVGSHRAVELGRREEAIQPIQAGALGRVGLHDIGARLRPKLGRKHFSHGAWNLVPPRGFLGINPLHDDIRSVGGIAHRLDEALVDEILRQAHRRLEVASLGCFVVRVSRGIAEAVPNDDVRHVGRFIVTHAEERDVAVVIGPRLDGLEKIIESRADLRHLVRRRVGIARRRLPAKRFRAHAFADASSMRDIPILYRGPMVRALLAGRKTQTRRVMKQQPKSKPDVQQLFRDRACTQPVIVATWDVDGRSECCPSPYGAPGDRHWVRETWAYHVHAQGSARDEDGPFVFAADGKQALDLRLCDRWRPSIFMPRTASRISRLVIDVRIEQLQDISEADAVAEGIDPMPGRDGWWRTYRPDCIQHWDTAAELGHRMPSAAYASLWESLHGEGSWAANPWLWVTEFKELAS